MIIKFCDFIRHSQMGKGSFWVIDGIKVKKKNPFIFENIPHQQNVQKQIPQKQIFHFNAMTNEEMARNFFADNIQDLPNHKIDYGTFRNSASSLRDFYLFGPPPVTQSTNQLFYPIEDPYMQSSQVRKSVFVNEFVGFSYKQSN